MTQVPKLQLKKTIGRGPNNTLKGFSVVNMLGSLRFERVKKVGLVGLAQIQKRTFARNTTTGAASSIPEEMESSSSPDSSLNPSAEARVSIRMRKRLYA